MKESTLQNKIFPVIGDRYEMTDEKSFIEKFKYGVHVNLFHRNQVGTKYLGSLIKTKSKRAIICNWYCESIEDAKWHWDDFKRSYLTPLDVFDNIHIGQIMWCTYVGCRKFFQSGGALKKHQKSCIFRETKKIKVVYKQILQSHLSDGEKLLQDLGFNYQSKYFVCFDIETVTRKCYNFDNPQQIISIGCQASWRKSCFLIHRDNSNVSSGQKLVKEFIKHLDELHKEFLSFLPLEEMQRKLEEIASLNFATQSEKKAAENTLNGLKRLKIFSFNGERYDNVCLYPYLIALFGESDEITNVIKRGSGNFHKISTLCYSPICLGVMSISTAKYIFLDVINFVGGMTLKQFGINYVGHEITKGIFPHRHFGSIEEIRKCKEFPPYDSFQSDLVPLADIYRDEYLEFKKSLKQDDDDPFENITIFHTSIQEYIDSKNEFEYKLDSNQWFSFLDYLSEYCMLDVQLLSEGFSNYIEMFMDEFNISPLDSISMPSLAYRLMLKQYGNNCASMFSFSSKFGFLNELLREKSLMGGFVGESSFIRKLKISNSF